MTCTGNIFPGDAMGIPCVASISDSKKSESITIYPFSKRELL
jgi:hypothetical protein